MATVRELLDQRTQELAQLLDQIREETQGDINLERLTELSDELGARADSFAQTLSSAREALEGGAEEGEPEAAEEGAPEEEAEETSEEESSEGGEASGADETTGEEEAEAG